ncbi:ABC transporter ATP-binding protein [Halobacteria archaeon AArc-m2/3/4]|uniref:ABC transporter ATP-binding protein n=1 Tax=Natronoglomus mannanivorans TaxID=2979990 RepID=A0AAP3E0Z1_9EURY|nr:ABC transporter ATP-binding protein [Halobacteria archaeon AArc-xg1-1]MCU4972480.1 ABC transporter ATP-binding protein [Halobacteria archaeon AArc-m2/3/4]
MSRQEPTERSGDDERNQSRDRPCIRVSSLEKSFGDEGVLKGIDLTVETGELLAVMGPNGVGKSVLFSCLAGSDHPSAGTVEVLGADPTTRSDTTGFLLQDALCVDRLTGRENLRFYEQLHPNFTDDWREYVEALDIADDLDKRVENYSGGMKRKLELAIALSIDVPLYLLDEPTAALDLTMIQAVHGLIREKQAEGKTVVVSSHRPMDVEIADRIAFVADGRVVATGPPDELFEAVPTVVETRLSNAEALAEIARGGEVFQGNGGVRGFLSADSVEAVDLEGTADAEFEIVSPGYTDLFNYYTRLSPTNGR